jgi:hypothetical protein
MGIERKPNEVGAHDPASLQGGTRASVDSPDLDLATWDDFVEWFVAYWPRRGHQVWLADDS